MSANVTDSKTQNYIGLIQILMRATTLMTALVLIQLKIHGQNLESLYKYVPMRLLPVEYLPDDYKGPNAGTEKDIIGDNTALTSQSTLQRTFCTSVAHEERINLIRIARRRLSVRLSLSVCSVRTRNSTDRGREIA